MTKISMSAGDFKIWRLQNQWGEKECASLIGVTFQAVRLWEADKRRIPETTVRLIKLFQKYPQLVKEF